MANLFLLVALLLSGGCVSSGTDGTTRHFIFGFGVVTVNNAQTNIAVVQKVNAIGIYGGTGPGSGKFGIGYMDRQTIEVVTNANLLIEVNRVGKQMTVTVPCQEHYQ